MNTKTPFLIFAIFLCLTLSCGSRPPAAAQPAAPAEVKISSAGESPVAPVAAAPSESGAAVPVTPRDPTWGSRGALVTIVQFSDFQCPFCSRAEPTLARLRETYGPEALRIVWKNEPLPFHPNARPAAEAAMGVFVLAGNAAFWQFHALAFANQSKLGPDAYRDWASQAGVADMRAFDDGLRDHTWAAKVDEDSAVAQRLDANGTPTFFINGVRLVGAQPIDKFREIVDDQMEKARARVEHGTPRDRVYAELARDQYQAPPREQDDDDRQDATVVFKVPVGSSPVRGSASALVTIVEFADFQCPFCARAEPTLQDLAQQYGDKLRLVFKHEPLPFHPHAEPAAQAAIEVRAERGDGAFWLMHDALFANQRDLDDGTLVATAVRLGANAAKVKAAIASHAHKRVIDADRDLAGDLQANGTPHFFINGRRLAGAQPKERFFAIIDEEIKKAQALVARGVNPANVYEELTRDGKGPPDPEKKEVSGIPAGDPARGPVSAKVTIHEFADFECPFCGRVEPTLKALDTAYAGKLRWVWHDLPLPFHPHAEMAAEAAREARAQKGDGAFWSMHDALFDHQRALERADLDGYARGLGLDMSRWRAALDGAAHDKAIKTDAGAAGAMSISGTPSFVIVAAGASSGYWIAGAQPAAKFRKLVDRAMNEAR